MSPYWLLQVFSTCNQYLGVHCELKRTPNESKQQQQQNIHGNMTGEKNKQTKKKKKKKQGYTKIDSNSTSWDSNRFQQPLVTFASMHFYRDNIADI